jgi:hypothetical protein
MSFLPLMETAVKGMWCRVAGRRGFGCARAPGVVVLVGCVIASLLWSGVVVSSAWAGYEQVGRFPRVPEDESLGAMPLVPASTGVAADDATGEVYVADGAHARVERLNSEGGFLGVWGWNVISTGPGKVGYNLEEMVRIKRTGGGEDVVYKGEGSETSPLSYEAKAEVVEEALRELKIESETEGAVKGEVKVVKIGSGEYRFTYGGALGDELSGAIGVVKHGLEGEIEKPEVKQGSPAFEDCVRANGDICRKPKPFGTQGGEPGEFFSPGSVAVDQENGDVYVLDSSEHPDNAVQVFRADGERAGIEFGEITSEKLGKVGEEEKNPEKLRDPSSIAVSPEGNVYILDGATEEESRIAVFDSTGKFLESLGRTCGAGFEKGCRLNGVAVDAAGNVYTIGEEDEAYEFQSDVEPDKPPVCESPRVAGLETLTVDGLGEVVVYGEKQPSGEKRPRFYWLDACKDGKLEEDPVRSFNNETIPAATHTTAIAFDPNAQYRADRPEGILYSINPAFNKPETELNTGLIFAPTPIKEGPKVAGESVSDVGLSYATLNARIERYSDPIHYGFRYWTDSSKDSECSRMHECEAPVGGADVNAGRETISVTVSDLAPGATYHSEVVGYGGCNLKDTREECLHEGGVELERGVELGREFSTFAEGSEGLPDGRAYELVSPPFKDGGEVFSLSPESIDCFECLPGGGDEKFPMVSTSDGEEMVYEGYPFAATGDAVDENQYLATRTSKGWMTHDLSPDTAVRDAPVAGYKAFSPDLSAGVFVQTGAALSSDAPPDYPNVYLQSTAVPGDPVRSLWTRKDLESDPPHRGVEGTSTEELKFIVGGMAVDDKKNRHVIFAANDALTSETETAPAAEEEGANLYNLYEWVNGELRLVNILPGNDSTQPGATFGSGTEFQTGTGDPDYEHAISADGSHIFWTDNRTHHLYVRIDGRETIGIPGPGGFLTASVDGSRVLLDDGQIYDLEAAHTVDLTSEKGGFEGILGASEDLSRVYFTDTKVLPGATANAYGSSAVEGGNNLYLWQEGSATVRYIATLGKGDDSDGGAMNIPASETGDWFGSPSDRTAQVTPDGRYVAFMSEAGLTGYESVPADGKCGLGRTACDEVFEYDAESKTNDLVCVSCNPTKERPLGNSTLSVVQPGSGFMAQPSNLADDGRVFFDSVDALSPEDQHPGSVENVYEYEPYGLHMCGVASGCVFLISSGAGESDSSFVNATPSGSDVFFTTRSQLVPQDQDDLVDLYDAREGGGFPTEGPAQACPESETCQGPLPSPSATVESALSTKLPGAAGNIVPFPPPRPPTRAQLLARALGACRHRFRTHHVKRIACEKSARKRYGHPAMRKKTARKK